jgi:4-hydroxybenzoate polyprenyltransferase
MAPLRTFLLLSRGATLPTVWSHCVAGWWLGGSGNGALLSLVLVGATLLYLAGSFMDDAFDADYDSEHRRSRPIPAGLITEAGVWRWAWTWVAMGLSAFLPEKSPEHSEWSSACGLSFMALFTVL